MKLAEALIERKAKQQRIADLENRIAGIATYQEGAEPSEDANKLLKELGGAYTELIALVKRINRTNSLTLVTETGAVPAPEGAPEKPLSDLIVERDLAAKYQATLRRIGGTVRTNLGATRYSRSEIRIVTRINLNELEEQIDHLGEQARRLDTAIQSLNWTVELI